ncbi:MAG: hypothetical protein ABIA62_03405 [Candidatus Woesearchaeota archaeon]
MIRTKGIFNMLLNNRKAQFYIFTAVLLIAYSTLLLQSFDVTPQPSKNFKRVYDNFIFESGAAVNNALFEQVDVVDEYDRFLDSFVSYSKMKKLNIEIFSILELDDRVYLSNKMRNAVTILNIGQTIGPGTDAYFLRSNLSELVLEVRDDVFHENIYKLDISNEGTDTKAVLRVSQGTKREIFVKE